MKLSITVTSRKTEERAKQRIRTMPLAIQLVQNVLDEIEPWPETVLAAAPGYMDITPHRFDRPVNGMTGQKRAKMQQILQEVRHRLEHRTYLAQMPDIQLISDDGTAASIWSSFSDIGSITPDEAREFQADVEAWGPHF